MALLGDIPQQTLAAPMYTLGGLIVPTGHPHYHDDWFRPLWGCALRFCQGRLVTSPDEPNPEMSYRHVHEDVPQQQQQQSPQTRQDHPLHQHQQQRQHQQQHQQQQHDDSPTSQASLQELESPHHPQHQQPGPTVLGRVTENSVRSR